MTDQDDPAAPTPAPAVLRRALLARTRPAVASYAAVLPRLRRGLPADAPDRRRRGRPAEGFWRGLLLDRKA